MALGTRCAAPNAILPYTPAIQASLRTPGSSGSHGPFKNMLVSLFEGGETTSQGLGMEGTTSSSLTTQPHAFHKHNQVGIVLFSHLLAPSLLSFLARVRRVGEGEGESDEDNSDEDNDRHIVHHHLHCCCLHCCCKEGWKKITKKKGA